MPDFIVSANSAKLSGVASVEVQASNEKDAIEEALFLHKSGKITSWMIGNMLYNYPIIGRIERFLCAPNESSYFVTLYTKESSAYIREPVIAKDEEEAISKFNASLKTWLWNGLVLDGNLEVEKAWATDMTPTYEPKIEMTPTGALWVGIPYNFDMNVSYEDGVSTVGAQGTIELIGGTKETLDGSGNASIVYTPQKAGYLKTAFVYSGESTVTKVVKPTTETFYPYVNRNYPGVSISLTKSSFAKGEWFPVTVNVTSVSHDFNYAIYSASMSGYAILKQGTLRNDGSPITIMCCYNGSEMWDASQILFISLDSNDDYFSNFSNLESITVT